MINWLLPPKRSPNDSFPPGPSKTYCFSTFSQGSSRRCRLKSSRSRVNSFSFFNNSFRAASHSAGDTTFDCSIALVAMTDSPFLLVDSYAETDRPWNRSQLALGERGARQDPAFTGRSQKKQCERSAESSRPLLASLPLARPVASAPSPCEWHRWSRGCVLRARTPAACTV